MMRNLVKILTCVLLFFLFTAPTTADITFVKIRSDSRDSIVFKEFGFIQNGHLLVEITSASVTSAVNSSLSQPDPSRVAFFLISQQELLQFQHEHTETPFKPKNLSCDLDSKFISILFTFRDLSPGSSFHKSYAMTYPNWYSLRFANCNPLSYVSMDVRTELYNTDTDGNTKDYLSAGLIKLPSLYYNFSLIYVCIVGFWIFVCFKNHQSIHWIHLLIGVLLVVKGLNLFFGAEVQHYLNITGIRPHGLNVLFYIFGFIKVVLLYAVISVPRTKKVLMIVIPLQVLATVLSMRGDGSPLYTDSVDCYTGLMVLNFISVFAIFRTMFQTDHPGNYLEEGSSILGFAYLLIDLIMGIIVVCSSHWVSIAANEIATLGFFMVMLYIFMPFQKTNYLPVSPV